MNIDYTITAGNIIEASCIIGGGLLVLVTMYVTVGNIKKDMVDIKADLKKLGEVLIKIAVADTRITNLEQDIRELKHGRGFIQSRADGGINGEYP